MALLSGAKYPARNPVQNVADLKAQIAANEKGCARTHNNMIATFGLDVCEGLYGPRAGNAAESVRRVLDRLSDSEFTYEMDQGTVIKVKISVDKQSARRPSTSPAPRRSSRIFSTPRSPSPRAAVALCFRVMVEDEIPMNAGCLRPIRIVVPEASMLSPRYPAAVVAGNVETSQAVTPPAPHACSAP